MTTHQLIPAKPAVPAPLSFTPVRGGLLQRQCACGGTPSPSGECAECEKKKRILQREANDPSGPGASVSGSRLPVMQRKLTIGASNDPLEQEADRVADQVLAAPTHPAVSGAPPHIQRFTGQPTGQADTVPASVDRVLASPGAPLDLSLQQDMEQRFGYDFSRVRVHSGAAAEQSAQEVIANAYTVGHNIVFGAGRFAPGTYEGRRLIAHELTHVVQQSYSDGIRAGQNNEKRGLSPIPSPQTVQRQRANYHAGGCATCRSASAAGSVAHPFAQGLFVAAYGREIVAEAPVNNPHDDNGRLDLFRIDRFSTPKIIEYGEIKPDNDAGVRQGRRDLAWYGEQLSRIFRPPEWFVSRLDVAAPPGAVPFKDNIFPGCPWQALSVRSTKPIGHEPGLYLYKCDPPGRPPGPGLAQCCTRSVDDDLPFMGDWLGESKGDSKTTGESKGKGDGEPGKGDRGRRPVRTPGRDQPQQPTFRLPDWVPGAAVLAILVGIVALLSKTPQGRLGAFLGNLLGRFLAWLGLSIGVMGTAGASPGGGGGSPTGPPKGDPVKVPGKDTVIVPGDTVTVPGGTVIVPGGTDPTKPPAGTTPVPSRTPVAPKKKTPPAAVPLAPKKAPKRIKLALIEGLRLDTLSIGKLAMVEIDPGGPKEQVVVLKVKSVQPPKGGDVTVEFESVLLECSLKGDKCSSGGNIYTVTHPYQGALEDALVARAVKEVGNTEGMDKAVKDLERFIR